MHLEKVNISFCLTKYIKAVLILFMVLLTSCAIKANLKSYVGLPTQTQKNVLKAQISSECEIEPQDDLASFSQKMSWNFVAVVWAAAIILFHLTSSFKENNFSSKYFSSTRIRKFSIPIYLEFQKLILPFV